MSSKDYLYPYFILKSHPSDGWHGRRDLDETWAMEFPLKQNLEQFGNCPNLANLRHINLTAAFRYVSKFFVLSFSKVLGR